MSYYFFLCMVTGCIGTDRERRDRKERCVGERGRKERVKDRFIVVECLIILKLLKLANVSITPSVPATK